MQGSSKYQTYIIRLGIVFFIVLGAAAVMIWYYGQTSQKAKEDTEFVFNSWHYSQEDRKLASTVLSKAGLSRYKWEEGKLAVPGKEREKYETILAENHAFPQAPSDARQEALREMGPFESESKSRLRDLYAAARQLEQTIEHFTTKIGYATVGVRSRREQKGLMNNTVVTASIGVWTKEEMPLTTELISSITLAARHHLGIIENENISILDLRNGQSWFGTEDGVQAPQTASQQKKEKRWQTKFETTFVQIPGVRIDVSATSPEVTSFGSASANAAPTLAKGAVLGYPVPLNYSSDYTVARATNSNSNSNLNINSNSIKSHRTFASSESANMYQSNETPSKSELLVNIAIPKSYIQQITKGVGTPGQSPQEVYTLAQKKAGELLNQVRLEAETLLRSENEGSNTIVQVSVFSDGKNSIENNIESNDIIAYKSNHKSVDTEVSLLAQKNNNIIPENNNNIIPDKKQDIDEQTKNDLNLTISGSAPSNIQGSILAQNKELTPIAPYKSGTESSSEEKFPLLGNELTALWNQYYIVIMAIGGALVLCVILIVILAVRRKSQKENDEYQRRESDEYEYTNESGRKKNKEEKNQGSERSRELQTIADPFSKTSEKTKAVPAATSAVTSTATSTATVTSKATSTTQQNLSTDRKNRDYLYDSSQEGEEEWEKYIQLFDEEDEEEDNSIKDNRDTKVENRDRAKTSNESQKKDPYVRLDLKGHKIPAVPRSSFPGTSNNANTALNSSDNTIAGSRSGNNLTSISNERTGTYKDREVKFPGLATADPQEVVFLLREERPTVVAAILSCLSEKRRNEIMELIEDKKRELIKACLIKKRTAPVDLLNEMERILDERRTNSRIGRRRPLSV